MMIDGSRFADCSSGQMGETYYEQYKVQRHLIEKTETSPFLLHDLRLTIGLIITGLTIVTTLIAIFV